MTTRRADALEVGDKLVHEHRVCEVAREVELVDGDILADHLRAQVRVKIFNEDGSVAGACMFTCDPEAEFELVG